VADAIDQLCSDVEEEQESGSSLEEALGKVLPEVLDASKAIIFNGDGYSDEWKEEAEERGLLNLPTTMDALPLLSSPKNIALFEKHKVLNEREIVSRQEIWAAQYLTTINI